MARHSENQLKWNGVSDYVTVNATSAQTAAISSYVYDVRIVSTTNCHINIGANPTAAATDNNGMYLPAGQVEYLHVNPGQKIAIIRDTADGVFSMAEMTR